MTKGRRRPHPNVRQDLLEKGLIVAEHPLDGVNLGRRELAGQPLIDQQHVGIETLARRVVVLGKVFHMILEGVRAGGRAPFWPQSVDTSATEGPATAALLRCGLPRRHQRRLDRPADDIIRVLRNIASEIGGDGTRLERTWPRSAIGLSVP